MTPISRTAAISRAAFRAVVMGPTAIAAIVIMMAITISSSISEKPRRAWLDFIPNILDARRGRNVERLVNTSVNLFPGNQLVENGQDLLPVKIRPLDLAAHGQFVAMAAHQLLHQLSGDVDITAQHFGRVPAEEQAIEQGGFPLGR